MILLVFWERIKSVRGKRARHHRGHKVCVSDVKIHIHALFSRVHFNLFHISACVKCCYLCFFKNKKKNKLTMRGKVRMSANSVRVEQKDARHAMFFFVSQIKFWKC